MFSRLTRVSIVLGVLVVSGIVIFLVLSPSALTGVSTSGNNQTVHFTIMISDPSNPDAGMNGSYYKSAATPWPVLNVKVGQTVVINVVNNGTEPHGFAIDHYFNGGVGLGQNHSYTVTFQAKETGTFRIYCSIFCAIHPLMQNGQLIVSS